MPEVSLSQRFNRLRGSLAVAAAAGGMLLSACSGEAYEPEFQEASFTPSVILFNPGAEFRTGPAQPEEDAEDNICYVHEQDDNLPITMPDPEPSLWVTPEHDIWAGFYTHELPDQIQEACADGGDGVVWVSNEHLRTAFTLE